MHAQLMIADDLCTIFFLKIQNFMQSSDIRTITLQNEYIYVNTVTYFQLVDAPTISLSLLRTGKIRRNKTELERYTDISHNASTKL